MTRKVLVIEDERDLARLLKIHLQDLQAEVTVAHDGNRGLELALAGQWNLVILDIMLPGIDGLEVCRRIRGERRYTPILMLTAKDSELDRVLGLEIGADDYVTKPFSIRELMARVKSIFRRVDALGEGRSGADDGDLLEAGDISMDRARRKATVRGKAVSLTAKEFDLLEQLVRRPGMVFTREQLLELVWDYNYDGYEHTVISHINRLRGKIEDDPSRPRYILTVRGVGYKFAEPGEQP